MSKPAATNSTIARATSATTRRFRARRCPPPFPVWPLPSLRLACTSGPPAKNPGATPKTTPAPIDSNSAKPSTQPSMRMSCTRGNPDGNNELSSRTPPYARNTPNVPPTKPRTTLSVSSCRTIRFRPAPSATRMPISRARVVARVRNRFAMFTQAISSTVPTDPSRTSSAVFTLPATSFCSGTTPIVHPESSAGHSFASRAAIASISACARIDGVGIPGAVCLGF